MKKKRICFIAQFPPPVHGLSIAVNMLYHSKLNSCTDSSSKFVFERVNITDNKKFILNCIRICKSRADLFYFTLSESRWGNFRDLMFLKLLELQHKKCIVHRHGGRYRRLVETEIPVWQRRANYKAISMLAGVIVLGETLKDEFRGMIDENRIFVVPNGIDEKWIFDETELKNKQCGHKTNDIKNILYLSNLIEAKGYRKVLELAKVEKEYCLSGRKQRFHFHFAGDFYKDAEEVFYRYITDNGLEEYVTYHGMVFGEKKKKLLQDGDIFILLSKSEGQPLSMLEAMGHGMMIVTTKVGCIPDFVKNGENGILIDMNEDVECIYEKITSNEKNIIEMGKNNWNLCRNNYTYSRFLEKIERLFEYLIE